MLSQQMIPALFYIIIISIFVGIVSATYPLMVIATLVFLLLIISLYLNIKRSIYIILFSVILLPFFPVKSGEIATLRLEDIIVFLIILYFIMKISYKNMDLKFNTTPVEFLQLLLVLILLINTSINILFFNGGEKLSLLGHFKVVYTVLIIIIVKKIITNDNLIRKFVICFFCFGTISAIIGALGYLRVSIIFDLIIKYFPRASGGMTTLRATGTFDGNPNYFGTFLMMLFSISYVFSINEKVFYKKVLLKIISLISLITLFLTFSRGALLAFLVSLIVIFYFGKKIHVFFLLPVFLLFLTYYNQVIWNYLSNITTTSGVVMSRLSSLSVRLEMWSLGFEQLRHRYFIGSGISSNLHTVDNFFLEVFYMYGIGGLLIYIYILLYIIRSCIYVAKNSVLQLHKSFAIATLAIASGIVTQSISASPITNDRISILFWCLIAIILNIKAKISVNKVDSP